MDDMDKFDAYRALFQFYLDLVLSASTAVITVVTALVVYVIKKEGGKTLPWAIVLFLPAALSLAMGFGFWTARDTATEAARDPEHGDRVRVAAHELIGSVKVIEEGEHIIAEVDGSRLLMPSAALDVTGYAQESLPRLHPLHIVLV